MIASLPRPIRLVWSPFATALALAPLALTQTLQGLSVLLLPLGRPVFRKANTALAASIWGSWALALQHFNGTRIDVEGDPLPDRENAIVICNHLQMGDIVVLMALALRHGRVGHMKWLVKDVIKWVPGVGWGMMFLDCAFLKRDWARDETTLRKVFAAIADNRLPVWLVSFPEGTRRTPRKLREAQERSKAKGVEPYKHLLPPRPTGFAASVFALRHHVKAVYSVTVDYLGEKPSLVGMIRGDLKRVRVEVKRYPIEALPESRTDLGRWLMEDYRRKDRWLDQSPALT